jgi:glutathione synthase/RimK-type ligase-like ATP-grasp enzyme
MFLAKIIRHSLRFFYVIRKTSFKGLTSEKTDNIVWLKINGLKFFREDQFVDYMALIHSLSSNGFKFKLSLTTNLGKYSYKNVFFRYSKKLDPFQFGNYTRTLHFFSEQLEDQKCFVYPKSNEILFWENKGHMTQKFFEHKISTPKTYLITNEGQFESIDLTYPYLIKEEHSSSAHGLYKIKNQEDLNDFFKKHDYFSINKFLLAQELLNMRRDLRVILVGNKIVHHYWRINKSDEWKPTSTSHGSGVDFGSFPEQWREFIIDQFRRLDLTTGAFDIAWRNDDLSSEPLILEVSPNYQPNPAIDLNKMNFSYGEYKEKLLFRDSYDCKFVDIVFSLINEQIVYLKTQKQIR